MQMYQWVGADSHVIVWDLETVPDPARFAAANDLVAKNDDEIPQAIGDKFPKHIYHWIVCIGALSAAEALRSGAGRSPGGAARCPRSTRLCRTASGAPERRQIDRRGRSARAGKVTT
jgi:hypothetical protein